MYVLRFFVMRYGDGEFRIIYIMSNNMLS